jgi:hypothetical protein
MTAPASRKLAHDDLVSSPRALWGQAFTGDIRRQISI